MTSPEIRAADQRHRATSRSCSSRGAAATSTPATSCSPPFTPSCIRRLLARCDGKQIDHTLQATALVHEAYLRLIDQRRIQWRNRAQFFGVAAQLMRRILVDHARGRDAAKRGGGVATITLEDVDAVGRAIDQ